MEISNKRLLSIDILRGFTIIFMIIVNDPGSWSHVYSPLLHAKWNGIRQENKRNSTILRFETKMQRCYMISLRHICLLDASYGNAVPAAC